VQSVVPPSIALETRRPNVSILAPFAESYTTKLHEFIRRYSFAVLTSHGEGGLTASHLPLLLDADAGPHGQLLGHMARANTQWRGVRGEGMAVFPGPHVYGSPPRDPEAGPRPTRHHLARRPPR